MQELNPVQMDIVTVLKEKNIMPSLQRIRILDFLLANQIHPTVDTIYQELGAVIPTLSRTTVYNTLSLFKEKEIIKEVLIEENEIRYDLRTSFHGHFKCLECGSIYDFSIEKIMDSLDEDSSISILERDVYYKGVCKECLK